MYTETRVFSIQIFITLFKDTIARGKRVSILEKVLKDFQRYPDVLKNMAKIKTSSFKKCKIIYLQNNHDQTSISCF